MFEFNLLDYLIIIILFLSIINGLKQGFIRAITDLTSIVLAIILGILLLDKSFYYLNYYFNIGDYLTNIIYQKWDTPYIIEGPNILSFIFPLESYFSDFRDRLIYLIQVIISFLSVFGLSMIFLKIIFGFLAKISSWGILAWFNRGLGVIFITLKNLIIFLLIISLGTPVIDLLSRIGLKYAIIMYGLIENSVITNLLLFLIKTNFT